MECQKMEAASVETNHLNGFSAVVDPFNLRELPPVGPVIENLANNSDKESLVQSDMSTLLHVFKDIYDQRIASIENNADFDRNRKNEEKVNILEKYNQHLLEQNDTFISTMLELETEAQERVKQMENRLKTSARTTMESALNVHECEKEMRRLVQERLYVESLYNDAQQHLSLYKEENNFLRDQNCNLSHDVQALLHIIHHARSTGHWEMSCVTFCEVTPEQVFGPVQSISNAYVSESPQSEYDSAERAKKGLSSDISSQETTDSSTSSPYTVHPGRVPYDDQNSNCLSYSDDSHTENPQIFPLNLPSSGISLPKCISLPDIGNIYSFTNVVRKSHSYCTFAVTSVVNEPSPMEKKNCGKPNYHTDDTSETQKCKSTSKKSEPIPCIRKGQSEPHLFMFGDNIYVYRPCEPIKKASNIALHDDYEMSLPPCESIDLKFPTEESKTNVYDWAVLNKTASFGAPQHSYYKDDDSSSSCTCSDPEIETFNKEMLTEHVGNKVSISVQTDDKVTYSIGLQAAIERVKVQDKVENGSYRMDFPKMLTAMQNMKDSLIKAEDKAQAKEMLVSQLQDHLTSAVKEVELKDTALSNLEKKLDLSRNECIFLKQQIMDLNSEILRVLKDLEDVQVVNENLCLKMDVKEEKIQEIVTEQKVLQEQKRALLTRLDAQEDELENTKKEFEAVKNKAELYSLQVEQQSQIIRNLQEALVQSKRAFDAVHQKTPLLQALSNESKSSSRSSVVDI